ncbi:hypothetical protein B0H14DRAFT_2643918 [Mycena olivaceomarginata]|nr:hypothetical protein B0H14DRAFT_2643918 [Mycena olivaceomarginata]
MRKKNLAVQARSTNDERTDASPKHTVFLPKNSPSQPTKPSANRRENYAEEIRTKTTPHRQPPRQSKNPRRSEKAQTKKKKEGKIEEERMHAPLLLLYSITVPAGGRAPCGGYPWADASASVRVKRRQEWEGRRRNKQKGEVAWSEVAKRRAITKKRASLEDQNDEGGGRVGKDRKGRKREEGWKSATRAKLAMREQSGQKGKGEGGEAEKRRLARPGEEIRNPSE